jgi:Kef-type K+ transport system membrane component KefB
VGVVIFYVLFVVALLICTPRSQRVLALTTMAAVGAAIWLAVRINLHSILGSFVGAVVALFWEFRYELLLILAAVVVLIVPILMIYVGLSDRLRAGATAQKRRHPIESIPHTREKK